MSTNTSQYVKEQYKDSANLDIRIGLHELYSTNKQDWHEWVFDHIPIEGSSDVIEFGCGTGMLWSKNKNKMNSNMKLTLTDLSEGMLLQTKQAVGESPNIAYEVMDIQQIAATDHSFDIAIANHMLYHVPDLQKTLSEVSRILKPSGVFFAATNGVRHLAEFTLSLGTGLKEALDQEGSYGAYIQFLESKMNEKGYIYIGKDPGIFVCSYPIS